MKDGYEIKIATRPEEIEAAQRLRFEVFNLEVKRGVESSSSTGLDKDKYDPLCDHIIILDPQKEKVIGTYRMLLGSKSVNVGFYSESKFDLKNIMKLDGQILELGRSCIHRDYRNQNVLDLLWQGIADYILQHKAKYVFGCASLRTTDPKEVSEIFTFLKKRFYSDEKFRVYPLEKNILNGLDLDSNKDGKRILRKLPPLIQAYLKLGAKICGLPAVNPELNTTILFMLLEVENINKSFKKHFFKTNPQE
ncbi:MAG: GNAT family N-acyltransferase [Candidatus Omnitrophota bacterium]